MLTILDQTWAAQTARLLDVATANLEAPEARSLVITAMLELEVRKALADGRAELEDPFITIW